MEKEFVPYEIALKLKELGFDEPCLASYYTDIDENNLEGKHDYRKTFNGLEYHPLTKFGTGWEPNFIRNTESVHYVSAPTFSQAFRWFREKHGLSVLIHDCLDDYIGEIVEWAITENKIIHQVPNRIETYEQAELACLNKLIEIVKSKSK